MPLTTEVTAAHCVARLCADAAKVAVRTILKKGRSGRSIPLEFSVLPTLFAPPLTEIR